MVRHREYLHNTGSFSIQNREGESSHSKASDIRALFRGIPMRRLTDSFQYALELRNIRRTKPWPFRLVKSD